jgi:TRAP-type C4-dicarboxylate transport system permease small subunit
MVLDKCAHFIGRVADPVARYLNFIAMLFLAAMMVLTGVDVGLRYFFNRPISGSYELTQYMMPMVVAFGLAHCALEDGHVQVELLTSKLPIRLQNVMKSVANLALFAVFVLIAWQATVRGIGMIVSGLYTEVLYLPIYPFVFVVTLGCLALSLVALKKFFQHLSMAVQA